MADLPVIIQIDDDENYLTVGEIICFNMGLTIRVTARNVNEAKAIISQIEQKKLKPDIAIISSFIEVDIDDGMKLAKKLRELVPSIKIIAYTTDKDTTWGDALAEKTTRDSSKSLIAALEKFTNKPFNFNNIQ